MVAGVANLPDLGGVTQSNSRQATSVWDLKKRSYLWRDMKWGEALSFSPDDQFLLTNKHIIKLETGAIVGSDYIGTQGKLSPDNKTLLTRDDKAFYIYQIQ